MYWLLILIWKLAVLYHVLCSDPMDLATAMDEATFSTFKLLKSSQMFVFVSLIFFLISDSSKNLILDKLLIIFTYFRFKFCYLNIEKNGKNLLLPPFFKIHPSHQLSTHLNRKQWHVLLSFKSYFYTLWSVVFWKWNEIKSRKILKEKNSNLHNRYRAKEDEERVKKNMYTHTHTEDMGDK